MFHESQKMIVSGIESHKWLTGRNVNTSLLCIKQTSIFVVLLLQVLCIGSFAAGEPLDVQKVEEYLKADWLGKPLKDYTISLSSPSMHERLEEFLNLPIGIPVTYELIRNNIKRLYLSDHIDYVQVSAEVKNEGVVLDFHCIKSYQVEDIVFSGGYSRLPWLGRTSISKIDLNDGISLQLGGKYSWKRLDESRKKIIQMFQDDGFLECAVTANTDFNDNNRTVQVTFKINRGKAARIKEFYITRNKTGLDRFYDIFSQYRFTKWKLYRYQKEKFGEELKKMERYYRRNGYYKASVSVDKTVYNENTGFIDLYITIDPGSYLDVELLYSHHLWNFFWNVPWLSELPLINNWFDFTPTTLLPVMRRGNDNRKTLQKGKENIITVYKSRGFENVTVSLERSSLENNRGQRITYVIDEGKKVRVRRIRISGNSFFKTPVLLGTMRIKEKSWNPLTVLAGKVKKDFNGIFVTEEFQKDLEALTSLYIRNGFQKCTVTGFPEYVDEYTRDLTIIIEEGVQTVIEKIECIGNSIFPNDTLLALLPVKPGIPYYKPDVEQSRLNLLLAYESEGYISSNTLQSIDIQPQITFRDYNTKVEITFLITEKYQIFFDKPIITGNIKTKERVFQREFQFGDFTPYSLEKLLHTRERLYKLGIFERVTFEETALKHPYYSRTPVFTLKEKKSGSLDFGGGWDSADGVNVFGSISDRNLFDRGQSLTLQGRVNQDATDSKIELVFQEPYLGHSPVLLSVNLYRRFESEDIYELRSGGGRISLSQVFRNTFRTGFEYRLESIWTNPLVGTFDKCYFDLVQDFDSDKLETYPRRISSITPKISYDSRDNPFLPTRGYVSNMQLEWSSKQILGSEVDFTKFSVQGTVYFPTYFHSVLVGNINFGASQDLPIYERFRLGGPSTMRGFRPNAVGPQNGQGQNIFGNTMFLTNVEYRFPFLWGFGSQVFVDVGNVWLERVDKITSFSMESSAGIGIRYDFSFGPMRLDYGFDFDGTLKGRRVISFSIGHPF